MIHMVAKEAKNRFGQLLTVAMREPVTIDKNGKPVAVVLSTEEYQRFEHIEDSLLALKAKMAREEGFLGEEKSEELLKDLLNA
jgi:prevent-host-death family protein